MEYNTHLIPLRTSIQGFKVSILSFYFGLGFLKGRSAYHMSLSGSIAVCIVEKMGPKLDF